ncbi:L-lactate dehydrogenase [Desulfonispora thiosulfatigenes DSM 11270]|uniref:L-lactate dehydrogenase n=1 Tax=Desulfonispora thiosulfatigenes DSM 11270 TaxID=656914 RepID=A0A1W1UJA7_DESTI|nr:L-lactate dehydrogenase [Desulfonispora thiosulfatigenes]SMB81215.1 L-lactate dehydrogenase [Desulfonispora thiosulfatigenes DSM 11270]
MNSSRKVSVIGAGAVGSQVAFSLMLSKLAQEIVLVDVNAEKAKGEAVDLAHGTPLVAPMKISHADFSLIKDSDIILYAAGVGRKPGETRLDLVNKNLSILKTTLPKIEEYAPNSILVIIANPVDILTYATLKLSNFPPNRVIGSGTVIDSNRLRYYIGDYLKINPSNVEAHIVGEHGASAVPLWSDAKIQGFNIDEFAKNLGYEFDDSIKQNLVDQTKNSPAEVIKGKGATNFAIAVSATEIVRAILNNESTLLPVSTYIDGAYGINDVCLSLPTLLDNTGVKSVFNVEMNEQELKDLKSSAEALSKVISDIF